MTSSHSTADPGGNKTTEFTRAKDRLIRLTPNDTIVVETDDIITESAAKRLHDDILAIWPDHRVVVVERASLRVLRAERCADCEHAIPGATSPHWCEIWKANTVADGHCHHFDPKAVD